MATADSAGRGPGAMARHIASVAARLFATRGYDATSVRTIAEEAGVTKPTLYYHFGSKEGLAQALLTVPMTELVTANRAILEEASDPVEALARITEAHFAFCREDPDRARFLFALLFGPLGAGLEDQMKRFGDTFVGLITEAVRCLAERRPDRAGPRRRRHEGVPGADGHRDARLPLSGRPAGARAGTPARGRPAPRIRRGGPLDERVNDAHRRGVDLTLSPYQG